MYWKHGVLHFLAGSLSSAGSLEIVCCLSQPLNCFLRKFGFGLEQFCFVLFFDFPGLLCFIGKLGNLISASWWGEKWKLAFGQRVPISMLCLQDLGRATFSNLSRGETALHFTWRWWKLADGIADRNALPDQCNPQGLCLLHRTSWKTRDHMFSLRGKWLRKYVYETLKC